LRRFLLPFLFASISLTVAGVIAFAICAMSVAGRTARQAYYVQCVSEMVIFHLDANDRQWPRSWDDIQDDKANCGGLAEWPLADLKQNVSVDWNANVAELRRAASKNGEPPFRAVWLTDGSRTHWLGLEPNQQILDYLNGKRTVLKLPPSLNSTYN
jgi:hypothetical protein